MESIHRKVSEYKEKDEHDDGLRELLINNEKFSIPQAFLTQYLNLDE